MTYDPKRSSKTATALRALAATLDRWPLLLAAAFLVSPEGPHLRVSYDYRGTARNPVYLNCTYLGSRGLVTTRFGLTDACPLIAWIDNREAVR